MASLHFKGKGMEDIDGNLICLFRVGYMLSSLSRSLSILFCIVKLGNLKQIDKRFFALESASTFFLG